MIPLLLNLKNTYYFMRHGESEANVEGIIVSDPELGCVKYGLTENGCSQVQQSIGSFQEKTITTIISSDFLRARQTADIVAAQLTLSSPVLEKGLRERWFGEWEGFSDVHYSDVWSHDQQSDSVKADKRVEKVEDVLQRGLNVIERLEAEYDHETLLLVSHGDMLQILRTAFDDVSASQHRSLAHHQTAQILKF